MLSESKISPVEPERGSTTMLKREAVEPVVVAVFPMQSNVAGLSNTEVRQLSDYVGVRLAESRQFQVVPNDALRTTVRELKKISYSDCGRWSSFQIERWPGVGGREERQLSTITQRCGAQCITVPGCCRLCDTGDGQY